MATGARREDAADTVGKKTVRLRTASIGAVLALWIVSLAVAGSGWAHENFARGWSRSVADVLLAMPAWWLLSATYAPQMLAERERALSLLAVHAVVLVYLFVKMGLFAWNMSGGFGVVALIATLFELWHSYMLFRLLDAVRHSLEGSKRYSLMGGTLEMTALNSDQASASGGGSSDKDKLADLTLAQVMVLLQPYFWPSNEMEEAFMNRVRAVSTYLFVALAKVATVTSPLFIASATNALYNGDYTTATRNVILYCSIVLVGRFFREMQGVVYLRVRAVATVEIARRTLTHLLALSWQWHATRKQGEIVRSIDRGTTAVGSLVNSLFLYLIPSVLETIATVIVFLVHFQQWSIACVVLSGVGLYALVTVKITAWRKKFRENLNKADNKYHDRATDALLCYEAVKTCANERFEIERFADAVRAYSMNAVHTQGSLSLLNIVQQVIIQLTLATSLILAVQSVRNGDMSVGDFVAVQVYVVGLFVPLSFLGTLFNSVITALIDVQHLSAMLEEEPDVQDAPDACSFHTAMLMRGGVGTASSDANTGLNPMQQHELVPRGVNASGNGLRVEFRNVSFRYPGQAEHQGIHDINFVVEPGTTTALVGHTGAGKSTISRLLTRFYDTDRGQILLGQEGGGEVDIRDITQESLHQEIGVVPQDTILFNDTIEYNIRYGKVTATREEVRQAAAAAQILDFIEKLPQGWDTPVGERGIKLSGGEKQRVSIARCMLKNPPIVLLDEATSALDLKTERSVQQSLNALGSGRTVVTIAHRLSTIKTAEQILVLKAGVVVERGTHHELLQRDGDYAALWQMQLQEPSTTDGQPAKGDDGGGMPSVDADIDAKDAGAEESKGQ